MESSSKAQASKRYPVGTVALAKVRGKDNVLVMKILAGMVNNHPLEAWSHNEVEGHILSTDKDVEVKYFYSLDIAYSAIGFY